MNKGLGPSKPGLECTRETFATISKAIYRPMKALELEQEANGRDN